MQNVKKKPKDVLIFELNEFNPDLLKTVIQSENLVHLKSLVEKAKCAQYKTNDRYNSGYLEPWVQWVSIHAGVPSTQHKIKHLGDVPDLNYKQCWETLSDNQISTGVWGVMNGVRRDKKHVLFFLPDPWTFSEKAHPKPVNGLLELPRYLSKNYRNLKVGKIFGKSIQLLKFLLGSGSFLKILAQVIKLIGSLIKRGPKHYVFISYFDYVSTLLFIQMKKKYQPKCSFLFLNSIAHIQHHHWREGPEGITPEIAFGYKMIDKILSLLKQAFPEDELVMHNGLSQMNTNHERPWVLYRQKDPLKFFQAMKLNPIQVEQHMTHDGHAFFENKQDCQNAYEFLQSLKINNKSLFHVEFNAENENKLFYQLKYTDQVSDNVEFKNAKFSYPFFKYFDRIVTRTGRHIPIGTVYSQNIAFSDHMFNHEFNQYIYHYLDPKHFPNPSATPMQNTNQSNPKSREALCTQ